MASSTLPSSDVTPNNVSSPSSSVHQTTKLEKIIRTPRGILVKDDKNKFSCHVSLVTDSVIRVFFLKDEKPPRQPRTWTVLKPGCTDVPWDGSDRISLLDSFPLPPSSSVDISPRDSKCTITTSNVVVEIHPNPLKIQWVSKTNGSIFASDRTSRPYLFSENTDKFRHYMERRPDDSFFGLGDKTGNLNLHGRRLRTNMTDALGYDPEFGDPLYKHWPFLLVRDSSTGFFYGILYDNMGEASFDLGCEHSNYFGLYRSYEAESGDLDYYFLVGPRVEDVIRNFLVLTGGMVVGPRWTLGYHCTAMPLADAPNAQECITEFIAKCGELEVPCSAFHFGSGYTSIGSKRYVFNWNRQKFPDPLHLMEQFRKAGMRVVANLKPCLLDDHPQFQEVEKSGAFIKQASTGLPSISQFWDGEGAHLDFTNEIAIKWWQEGLKTAILEFGISSAWNDNNEYELWDEDAVCKGFDNDTIPIELAKPLHCLLMTRASFEEQKRFSPEERVYTISRAGCPGIQRYAQTWSGDNTTSWKTLRYNLRTSLQFGLSGIFNIGHDVGGFAGPSPGPELLVRWVQSGVLHPRFIMNSWKTDGKVTTPWLHPEMLPLVRWAIRLRYRLIPYLYSLYREAGKSHKPILRPTFYDFPEDLNCLKECDDLMVGPNLLAAPVVHPDVRQREVYLPKGPKGWYDFYTEEFFPSGETVTVAAPLDRIPLFVPAGSCVFLTAETDDFSRLHDEPSRVVRVFPEPPDTATSDGTKKDDKLPAGLSDETKTDVKSPAGSSFWKKQPSHLWEDDGIGTSESEDSYRVFGMEISSTNETIQLSLVSEEGKYKLPYKVITVSLPASENRAVNMEVKEKDNFGKETSSTEVSLVRGRFRFHGI